ncbi:sialidase-4-like [Saccoglossus kowalevskii]
MVSFPAPPGSVIDEEHHNIWALFSNPADLGERKDLSIRLSTDSLKTWSFPWTLHTHAGAYSDMVFIGVTGTDSNAALHFAILYERGFRNAYHELAFRTFTLSDII